MRRHHKNNDKKQNPVWKKRFAQLEALGFEWVVKREPASWHPSKQKTRTPSLTKHRISDLDEDSKPDSGKVLTAVAVAAVNRPSTQSTSKKRVRQEGEPPVNRGNEEPSRPSHNGSSTTKDKHSQNEPSSHSMGDSWQQRLNELLEYKESNGHCRVPKCYEKNKKLGIWVVNMRTYHKNNDMKQDPVWKNRFAQLEAVGFEWEVNISAEDFWHERFEELCLYKEANGHCRVPKEYEKNRKLGRWVGKMRVYHKNNDKKQNPVWKKRFAQLEALGFVWGVPAQRSLDEDVWQERLNELREYKEANGDCRVPA
eukprot:CAMPEP_0113642614 /NCGR_PEP_ID=MMETSP0017_2-20120614/22390_1 /TAXON_ID=2856 /ORGANISM="Cylindrotheca closterium" /LENGTH=310 /DNA_ID=CAMNT_0000554053 /DNA_START=1 /DNA_END=929 /DNA_ORIENTATION=+ /assembly_acc=CAM_ASM_000147